MSRYVLIPEDSGLKNMQITIPNGLLESKVTQKQLKSLKKTTSKSNIKNVRKVIRRLNKQNVTVDGFGQAVHNGHVLKGIKYDKAVRYAARGIKKKKYFEINKLL